MAKILNVAEWDATKSALDYDTIAGGLGDRFLLDFEATFRRLEMAPWEHGRWVAPGVPDGVYHALFRVFQYRLVFVMEPEVVVLVVAHQAQEPTSWLDRLDLADRTS